MLTNQFLLSQVKVNRYQCLHPYKTYLVHPKIKSQKNPPLVASHFPLKDHARPLFRYRPWHVKKIYLVLVLFLHLGSAARLHVHQNKEEGTPCVRFPTQWPPHLKMQLRFPQKLAHRKRQQLFRSGKIPAIHPLEILDFRSILHHGLLRRRK